MVIMMNEIRQPARSFGKTLDARRKIIIHVDEARNMSDKTVSSLLKVINGEIQFIESHVIDRKLTSSQKSFYRFLRSIGVGSSLPLGFRMVHRGRGKFKIIYTPYDNHGQKRSTRRKVTS